MSKVILFLKSNVKGYTRRDGVYVKPHDDKRVKRADPAHDPERIARMADGANRMQAHEDKVRSELAPKRDERYQRILEKQPEWEKLEGVDILRSPGSDFAAFPVNGRRDSRMWQVFNVKTREPITQLRKDDVRSWLVKRTED